jgi:hypothetical protein
MSDKALLVSINKYKLPGSGFQGCINDVTNMRCMLLTQAAAKTRCLPMPILTDHTYGAFTYYFCKHMRDANAELTRSEALKRLRTSLIFNKYNQVPQLEYPTPKLKKKVLK